MVLSTKQHTRVRFDEDLEKSLEMIKTMSGMVEQQLKDAIALFRVEDKSNITDRCEQVLANDVHVNKMEIQIHDYCLYIIAKHQPKAQDLRLVFTIVKAASEFERIGDTVTKICETARKSTHVIDGLIARIEQFAENSVSLIHKATEALINMDLNLATEAYMQDNYRLVYKDIFRNIIEEAKQNLEYLKEYFIVVIALRQIERIGDRCRNLNEYVYYYTKGITPTSQNFAQMYESLHPELKGDK
ncbi:phosphate signaling complex protein PhoU [Psittacicella hinzii]|uniref:Phosphate-specific transport system accessory protein PhoU n=1 Tax=Psittacicella hinzii TaxID=2028575 RepID=A0A3A1YIF9_9GAMM|nr:phosphate signaling complex protein PhoU [Psittacicella hinzii]RIY36024.1 phosphate transport system regulatory protein PhoU [Psittacicella hinzii]